MNICSSCRAENESNQKYCRQCGSLIQQNSTEVSTEHIYLDRLAADREMYLKDKHKLVVSGSLRRMVARNLDPDETMVEEYLLSGSIFLVLTNKNFWIFQVQNYGGSTIDPNFSALWDSWTRSENNVAIPLDQLARFDPYPTYFQFLFTSTPEPFDLVRQGWELKKDKLAIEALKNLVNSREIKPAIQKVAVTSDKTMNPRELLVELKQLLEDGLINQEDFEAKKLKILDEM